MAGVVQELRTELSAVRATMSTLQVAGNSDKATLAAVVAQQAALATQLTHQDAMLARILGAVSSGKDG